MEKYKNRKTGERKIKDRDMREGKSEVKKRKAEEMAAKNPACFQREVSNPSEWMKS